jgi:hypothetical protein
MSGEQEEQNSLLEAKGLFDRIKEIVRTCRPEKICAIVKHVKRRVEEIKFIAQERIMDRFISISEKIIKINIDDGRNLSIEINEEIENFLRENYFIGRKNRKIDPNVHINGTIIENESYPSIHGRFVKIISGDHKRRGRFFYEEGNRSSYRFEMI